MSDTQIIGEIETRKGDLVVSKSGVIYTITVDGVERHPNITADEAIGALCHYLHGAEYTLKNLEMVWNTPSKKLEQGDEK